MRSADRTDYCCPVEHGDIYIMAADGTGVRRVTSINGAVDEPSFSPDGTSLVYSLGYELHIIKVDGTGDRVLLDDTDALNADPRWSPDGSLIAYAGSTPGYGDFDIFVIRPDGTGKRDLTNTRKIFEENPSWSPDGRYVAYSKVGWTVGIARVNGTGHHRVTTVYSLEPAWSPDGRQIALYACTADGCGIQVMAPDGSGLRLLSPDGGGAPDWQPLPVSGESAR